jgi:hypothetical protein
VSSSDGDSSSLRKMSTFCSSVWGTTGVAYILIKAIRRVLPIALEPFVETATPLTSFQLGYDFVLICFAREGVSQCTHTS